MTPELCPTCRRPVQTRADPPGVNHCRAGMTASYNGDCHWATLRRAEAAEASLESMRLECVRLYNLVGGPVGASAWEATLTALAENCRIVKLLEEDLVQREARADSRQRGLHDRLSALATAVRTSIRYNQLVAQHFTEHPL